MQRFADPRWFPALLVLISGIGTARMSGQEKPASPSRAMYPVLRYDEDWSFLSDPSKHNDFWDPVKFIPLTQDDSASRSAEKFARSTSAFITQTLASPSMTQAGIGSSVLCFTLTFMPDSGFASLVNSAARWKKEGQAVPAQWLMKTSWMCIRAFLISCC